MIIVIMAFVQMGPGLYIGARSICVLLEGDAVQRRRPRVIHSELGRADA